MDLTAGLSSEAPTSPTVVVVSDLRGEHASLV